MAEAEKNAVYICVIEHEGDAHPRGYKAGTSIEDLVKWAEEKNEPITDENRIPTEGPTVKDVTLSGLMKIISASGHHQRELIDLTDAVRKSFPLASFSLDVVEPVFKNKTPVLCGENFRIGKVEDNELSTIMSSMEKIGRLRDGLKYLPNAIFLSLIATFDSQMSDVVRSMLRIKSDRLKFSGRQIPLSKIMTAASIEEIVEEQIIEEVYLFSRGSHDEQVGFIEENFDVAIRKDWKRWSDFIEVFERRNLVAHGERYYTKRYVEICTKHGDAEATDKLGSIVNISRSYLTSSLSILSEFAILTIFVLWRKHLPKEKSAAFDSLVEISFECIGSYRARLASRICEFALSLKNSGIKEAQRLRLVVNLASAHLHMKEEEEAKRVLGKEDWSATSDDFQISVAALRKDIQEVNRLLPMIKASDRLSAHEFRIWPVFDFIKDDIEFQRKFEEVYNEPLIVAAGNSDALPNNGSKELDESLRDEHKTMH